VPSPEMRGLAPVPTLVVARPARAIGAMA
jgi:hypothetical protein